MKKNHLVYITLVHIVLLDLQVNSYSLQFFIEKAMTITLQSQNDFSN